MFKPIFLALFLVFATGCASTSLDSSGNPINRSTLIDTGLELGLGNLPIELPTIKLGFHLNFRRPTPQEEQDLNLSRLGKARPDAKPPGPAPAPSEPKPFKAQE
jgi:hypothetical protein